MNCRLCREELEQYREGKLPEGMNMEIKKHLESCSECTSIFHGETVIDQIIGFEKKIESNPFLSTRVLAEIERSESFASLPTWHRAIKPVLIIASIVLAITIGVLSGNFYYKPTAEKIPMEIAFMDDTSLELVNYLSNNE